jgi:predicted acyltransferase
MRTSTLSDRLVSVDFMRGLIMFLLAGESTLMYERLYHLTGSEGFWAGWVEQFFHVPWRGLHFWDLVQPAFMTIAGTSLYLSTQKRLERGDTPAQLWKHTLIRSLKLLACGVLLHCVYAGRLVWELWNVLSQLSVTLIIAFALMPLRTSWQILASVALLLLTDFLYRFTAIPGFDQPFVADRNFGTWMDLVLMGKINPDHWIAINFIPTAAHTIWGVLAGKLLVADQPTSYKIRTLLVSGLIGLLIGYGLDGSDLSPIIKRTSTVGFVVVSGGWVFLIMAFCYWLIDIKKTGNWVQPFIIVGMNAIFIYMFFETVGMQWLNATVAIFTNGVAAGIGLPPDVYGILASLATWLLEWYVCYWLYQHRVFVKL